jgi:lipoyl(octanoyl) transferase
MLKKDWKLLAHENKTGIQHMLYDRWQWETFIPGQSPPVLRFFSFSPNCITYGYKQVIENIINISSAEKLGWQTVRRPTGGGVVFHSARDISFSIMCGTDDLMVDFRKPRDVFGKITPIIASSLKHAGIDVVYNKGIKNEKHDDYCFNYVSPSEITYKGKKILGYAQRQDKNKVLVQGSLFVESIPKEYEHMVIAQGNYNASTSCLQAAGRAITMNEWAEKMRAAFKDAWGVIFT